MSAKMTVVYVEHTGHVVAALLEPPGGAPKLEALVGDGFPLGAVRVRSGTVISGAFDLPVSILKSKSIPLDARLIARPQGFVIDGDRIAQLPEPVNIPTATLTETSITVDLGANAPADTKVLAVVRGNTPDYTEQRIQAGVVEASAQIVALNFSIVPTGPDAALRSTQTFDVAIAVGGLPLVYATSST